MSSTNFLTFITTILVLSFWSFHQVECIVGGNSTKANEFKYVVYIKFEETGNYCNGGILSNSFILTSAHCVINVHDNQFVNGRVKVIGGTNNMINGSNLGIERFVKEMIVPSLYTGQEDGFANDFALLRLAEGFDLTDKKLEALVLPKQKHHIPTYDNFIKDKILKFAGFGNLDATYPTELDGTLRKANVVYSENCDGKWPGEIPISAFCAKMVNYDKRNPIGLCKNDYGAPLVRGKKTVVGIATFFDASCNENERPSVYTRIGQYADALGKIISDPTNIEGGHRKVANETNYFEPNKGETVEQIPYSSVPTTDGSEDYLNDE